MWNLESIHSTINQIAYYRDSGIFKSQEDYDKVIDSFQRMLDHLQLQAEKGVKFMPGDTETAYKAPIQFYINELILGSNTILLTLDNSRVTMVTYSVFNYLITRMNVLPVKHPILLIRCSAALRSSAIPVKKTGTGFLIR